MAQGSDKAVRMGILEGHTEAVQAKTYDEKWEGGRAALNGVPSYLKERAEHDRLDGPGTSVSEYHLEPEFEIPFRSLAWM